MVILQADGRNIVTMIDMVQLKMLVEVLRRVNVKEVVVPASEVLIQSGFPRGASDVLTAVMDFCSVYGLFVDKIYYSESEDKEEVEEAPAIIVQ